MNSDRAARIIVDKLMAGASVDDAYAALLAAWPTISEQEVDHVVGIAAARIRAESYRKQSLARTRRAANDN